MPQVVGNHKKMSSVTEDMARCIPLLLNDHERLSYTVRLNLQFFHGIDVYVNVKKLGRNAAADKHS